MCVGVANLATRAATPLAGGYEPPLRVRIEIWKLLQNRTRSVGEALSLPQCTQQSGSLNGIMCVGVANLATRAATPLAGGYEPPLRVRWKL